MRSYNRRPTAFAHCVISRAMGPGRRHRHFIALVTTFNLLFLTPTTCEPPPSSSQIDRDSIPLPPRDRSPSTRYKTFPGGEPYGGEFSAEKSSEALSPVAAMSNRFGFRPRNEEEALSFERGLQSRDESSSSNWEPREDPLLVKIPSRGGDSSTDVYGTATGPCRTNRKSELVCRICQLDASSARRSSSLPEKSTTYRECCASEAAYSSCLRSAEVLRHFGSVNAEDVIPQAPETEDFFVSGGENEEEVEKRARNPFLGKRSLADEMEDEISSNLGYTDSEMDEETKNRVSRRRNPFLGKRVDEEAEDREVSAAELVSSALRSRVRKRSTRRQNPFLGKRADQEFDLTYDDNQFQDQIKRVRNPFLGKRGDGGNSLIENRARNPFLGKRARNPFLGKRARNPFLGKRARNPFLGKRGSSPTERNLIAARSTARRGKNPFLGKRGSQDYEEQAAANNDVPLESEDSSALNERLDSFPDESSNPSPAGRMKQFAEKRTNPFLGFKRRNPFLGKRSNYPPLGRRMNPFLGKRETAMMPVDDGNNFWRTQNAV